nr:hypothetical protein [Candidatus Delongbacteria bacterium]
DFIEYYDSLNSEEDNEIKSTIENLYELDEREYNRLVKFLQEREKIIKEIRRFENQEDYSAFKKRNKIQGVSTFEILYKKPVYQGTKKKPNLTIFIKTENKDTLTTLNYRLNDILVYSVLGRKEDYVEILSSEIVEVKKIKINSIKDAVIKRLKLQNCYIRLDLSSITKEVQELSEEDIVEQRFQNEISDMGNLYTMPRIYKDIKANKAERKYLHSHYIHIKESSRYIAGEFYIYQNQIFKWLVN